MPKMAKKKPKRKLEEDEEDTPIISTSNSKPVEIDDEDNSAKGTKNKKKKHKQNPIEDSTKEKTEEIEACYLPGQKHDRPNERDPLRIFFDTLYQQLPDCELAGTWMMEWGLLPPDEATKVYELQLEKNQQGEPAEDVSLKKTSKVLSRKEDKKRKVIENSSSDVFILSNKKKKKKKKQKVSSS